MDKRLLLKIVAVLTVATVICSVAVLVTQPTPGSPRHLRDLSEFLCTEDKLMAASGTETKILDESSDVDSHIKQDDQLTNFGTATNIEIGSNGGGPVDEWRGVMSFLLPENPVEGARITCLTLRLYKTGHNGVDTALAREIVPLVLDKRISEAGVTWQEAQTNVSWTSMGGDYSDSFSWVAIPTGTLEWVEWDISPILGIFDTDWGGRINLILLSNALTNARDIVDQFASKDYGTEANRPQLVVTYEDPAPGKITDFTTFADPADPRKVGFKWTVPDDKDLVELNIRVKNATGVAYTDTTVTTNRDAGSGAITNLATPEDASRCYETSDLTEDTAYYFAGFLEDSNNTGTDSTKSNESTIIRDSVTKSQICAVGDNGTGTSIDVLEEVFYWYNTAADLVKTFSIYWGDGSKDGPMAGKNSDLSGNYTASDTTISLDYPERFEVGDKCILVDDNHVNVLYFIITSVTSTTIGMDRVDDTNNYTTANNARVLITRTYRFTEPRASFNPYIEITNGYGMLSDSVQATTSPDPIEAAPSVLCTLSPNPVLENGTFTFGFGNSVGNNYDQAIDLIGYNLDDGTGWQTTTAMKVQDTHASAGTKKIRCTVNEGDGTLSHSRGPRFEYVKTASGAVYTDITTESYSSQDTNIFAVNNDYLYLGAKREFRGFYPYLVPAAHASDVFTFEYYNGAWTALTIAEDNSSDFTAAGDLIFTMPTDWEKTTIDSDEAYWVRIRITTGPTNPPITEQFITALYEGVNYFDLVVESDAAIDLSSSSVLTNSYHDINYGHKSSVTSIGANSPAVSIDGNHPITVKMSGVAVTDSGTFQGTYTANVPDFNGTPNTYADDIEVLNDIYKNQRRVSIPGPTGTTLYGYISSFPMNYKGGHGYKGFWNITLLVTE